MTMMTWEQLQINMETLVTGIAAGSAYVDPMTMLTLLLIQHAVLAGAALGSVTSGLKNMFNKFRIMSIHGLLKAMESSSLTRPNSQVVSMNSKQLIIEMLMATPTTGMMLRTEPLGLKTISQWSFLRKTETFTSLLRPTTME